MGLLHDLVFLSADRVPGDVALWSGREHWSYAQLSEGVANTSSGLLRLGLGSRDRVAVFLPKSFEAVVAFFATSRAGGTFVPVNPVLKAAQVGHILRDSGARVLITSASRAEALEAELAKACPTVEHLVLVDA